MQDQTRSAASASREHHRPYDAVDRQGLAQRLKSARHSAGLTQAEAARKLSVSAGAVGQWETGGIPATERLTALADLFDISIDWLLGRSQRPPLPAVESREIQADLQLIAEARQLGVDLNGVVAEARQQRWLQQNRDALSDANAFLSRHGLWSDGKRQF